MSKQLQLQLDRLQQDHPIVRRHAVASIFQLLAQHSTHNSKAGQDALQFCLQQTSKDVLEETLLQLQGFVPKLGLGLQDAVDMTLAATAVPGSAAVVPILVEGLFRLLHAMVLSEQAQLGSWTAHPLNKVLLAQPLSHPSLLLGVQRILSRSAQAGKNHQQLVQQLLMPFVSFVMSRPDVSGSLMALKAGLHAQLVRAVCTIPALQADLLPHLISFLGAYSWSNAGQAAWLASLIPDLVDAVQSVEDSPGDALAEQLARVLLQLLSEAEQAGMSLQPWLAGLRRLAADWPTVLLPFLPFLATCITTAGNQEGISMLNLISLSLQATPAGDWQLHLNAGLLSLPLVSTLALHPSQPIKAWAGHVHKALRPGPEPNPKADGPMLASSVPGTLHGIPCLVQQADVLLSSMWRSGQVTGQQLRSSNSSATPSSQNVEGTDLSPMAWLERFEAALQRVRAADKDVEQGQERGLSGRQDEVMRMILTALLDHPQTKVQAAAARVCGEAVKAFPVSGISLLPLLIYKLQQSVVAAQQGGMTQSEQSQHATLQVALMRAIPCMAMHQTALPFVQRALTPFCQPGAPELILALGLKMHTQVWMTTGRGFNSVLAGLSGFSNAHPHAGDMLRMTRGACMRDVCRHDSSRGVQLVRAIQECLEDQCEAVAALGLQAVALLCKDDVLEFYAAWRVVHRAFPKMPTQELVAAEWVGMLKHGVLDADVHPDKAVVIIDMLWAAAGHASRKVRAAAYEALAAYPMDLLETLEALWPLQQCVQLLIAETDSGARAECEVLVGKALAHEHMRRRRYIGGATKPAGMKTGGDDSKLNPTEVQLMQALPKQLVQQSDQQARRPSAGVTLLLWGPPPPSQQEPSNNDKALAAQEAATAYEKTFQEIVQIPSALGSSQHALVLHSWGCFLVRWLAAVKASQGGAKGVQGGQGRLGDSLWRTIAGAFDGSSPVAAENAAVASGALCSVMPAGSHAIVTEVVQKLRRGMDSQSAGPARACALALGPASAHLHPTDAHTRQEVAEQLLAVLVSHTRTSFRAACAESLGLAVASSSGNKASDAEMGSLVQIVECLLSMLCTLCPAAVNPVKKMIVSTSGMLRMDHVQGVESSVNRGDEEAEVVLGIMTGLAHTVAAIPASAEASFATPLLVMAQTITRDLTQSQQVSDTSGAAYTAAADLKNLTAAGKALLEGCCFVQAAFCADIVSKRTQQSQQKQSTQEQSQKHTDDVLKTALSDLRHILTASKQGQLTGIAASSLGSVLNSALRAQHSTTLPQPDVAADKIEPTGSAQHDSALTESELRAALSELMAVTDHVAKLPGAAAGKQGLAMGLSALLGGALGSGGSPSSALINQSGWSGEAEKALQVLTQLALHDTNPRVAPAASWGLAAACLAQRQKKATTAVAGTNAAVGAQMRALARLPEDGAMRALVQAVLAENQDDNPQKPSAITAAMMRCLAKAPRLPPLDWGAPCQGLLTLATSTKETECTQDSAVALRLDPADKWTEAENAALVLGAACLLLALKHGSVASHGFGEMLDTLMTEAGFPQLPIQLGQNLLIGLPEVLNALSSQRAAAVASMLSTLSSNSNQQQASQLTTAAWTGLARLMHTAQDSNASTAAPPAAITNAAHGAMKQLLQQLPLPPLLLPGALLPEPSMDLDKAISAMTDTPIHVRDNQSLLELHTDRQREEEEARAWGAACACMQMMHADKVTDLLSSTGTDCTANAAFAQIVMVQRKKLLHDTLRTARQLCFHQGVQGVPALMCALGHAVQDTAVQHNVLLETLDAVQASDAPEQAMQFVSLLVAHWQAKPCDTWPVQLITAVSPAAAVQSLPHTLPALLQRKNWQKQAEPVTRRLIKLVVGSENLQQQGIRASLAAAQQSDRRSSCAKPIAQRVSHIAAACLVATRQHLTEDAWQHMPETLSCLRQPC